MHAEAQPSPRWERLSARLADCTGLHFPPERRADLRRGLAAAATDLGFDDVDACVEWLLATQPTSTDLRKLARHLTVGETYFFRERPSFNALATTVLPGLMEARRTSRRLRVWSAACSTGEEAYSLAIQVQQVLPEWREWDLRILATDINDEALHKARAGEYGEWSFRECAPGFREEFFSPAGDRRFRIRADVRDMVEFQELNLSCDRFPLADLILCRNLLIYFAPGPARRLVARFREVLAPDGWLVVSPAECSQSLFREYAPENFPGSVLYRKRAAGNEAPAANDRSVAPDDRHVSMAAMPASTIPTATRPPADAVPDPSHDAPSPAPARDTQKWRALARELADRGDLRGALDASERWIEADKLDPAAHYFVALVLQELGERARARGALHRAIYLLPQFALAHFALGNHARAEARHAEARRHFLNAERLLRDLPADEPVPESEGLTAGSLREIIGALVADT